MTLLLTVLLLVLFERLVLWIGQAVLLDFVYSIHLRIFSPSTAARQKQFKSEILAKKAELGKTSAQDQFAKWAKLRRSVDRGLADLEKLNSSTASQKTAFSLKFKTALWISTQGVQYVYFFWYRRSAVFFLPPGWFGPLAWVLSYPFAPSGSVSVGVWQMACRKVLKIGERAVRDFSQPRIDVPKEEKVADEKKAE